VIKPSTVLVICALAANASADPDADAMMQKVLEAPRGTEVKLADDTFMTMFRVAVKPTAKGGWAHARSTAGGFTVDLPVSFNDYAMRTTATDKVDLQVFAVGGMATDVKWSAVCMARGDRTLSPAGQPVPEDHIDALGDPVRAYARTVVLHERVCLLTVEAIGTAALPSEKDRKRFFASFQTKPTATPKK
jgi:hypothetical protein